MNRIVGLETEYGCLTDDPSGPPATVGRVRNWVFDGGYGLADLHQRDWDEPVGNGGFLFNGGRSYVDMSHLEYCTPECLSLRDLVRYDRAGDEMIYRAVADMGLTSNATFVRNNIDFYSGATFGCHENYLVRRSAPLNESNVLSLLAFLTLRTLYTGAGRVRTAPGADTRIESPAFFTQSDFQISQRADYINNDLFEWVQFNRAIINTRDEPLADPRKYRRLHLLHGDTSVLPATLALKIGTTSLMLDLLEIDRIPEVALADAVMTFRTLSHAQNGPWLAPLADGRCVPALEILNWFYERADEEFKGRDDETDNVLRLWRETLAALARDTDELVGIVDWVTKRWLFRQFVEEERIQWDHPWLRAQELEFHSVDPTRSLAWSLARTPKEWDCDSESVGAALREPPSNTRAMARVKLMKILEDQGFRYFVDWDSIDAEGCNSLSLLDPFEAHPPEMDAWMRRLRAFKNTR